MEFDEEVWFLCARIEELYKIRIILVLEITFFNVRHLIKDMNRSLVEIRLCE